MVGIGASAGGFEAFTQLLSTLPADTGMAFVLVQHLEPIDYFVTSLAQSRGPRAVGVVLSGTASDGRREANSLCNGCAPLQQEF